ncbi:MAG: gas vesicle protein GvpN [Chloroflexi bacterium]|nr:gas vesicle protein GvpN [Chloroflexota bacterium]
MDENQVRLLRVRADAGFVETDRIKGLTERALAYLKVGYPVHLCGPAGSGKTTLALHVAAGIGRPVVLMYGDEETRSSDLVGGNMGFSRRRVVDNFVHTVLKTEESLAPHWVDQRLLVACREGLTLVYDEFTRSRPEANNVLLSILEERVLLLPSLRLDGGFVRVHPNFAAVFTSNPEDYVGVHQTQDALWDRLVTIYLEPFDWETEVAITCSRSGLLREEAEAVVRFVRAFRDLQGGRRSLRDSIKIAKVLAARGAQPSPNDPVFAQTCSDVLVSQVPFSEAPKAWEQLQGLFAQQGIKNREDGSRVGLGNR